MPRSVDGFTYGCEVGGNPGGGFGLNDENRPDSLLLIAAQALLDRVRRDAGAVFNFQPLHVDAVGNGHPTKLVAEVAVHAAKHLFAGGERIDDTAFPRAGA